MADNDTTENGPLADLLKRLTALTDEAKAKEILDKAKADGLKDEEGARLMTVEDWTGYGLPKITARQLDAQLKAAAAKEHARAAVAPSTVAALLPQVPTDDDFLKSLQVGGVAKMAPQDVTAAVRAVFAANIGVFDIDDRLLDAIAARAEEMDEPYPEIYYDLEKARTKKAHADVLSALGVRGNFVTDTRKKQFLGKMAALWPALYEFQGQIAAWQENWTQKATNPAAFMSAFASMASGGAAPMPGLMDAPDTAPVVDAASGLIDRLNRLFSGPGIPVARALAADAVQMRQLLERDDLMAAVNAGNREEMLKRLGIAVTADLVRAERAVVQYVMGVMQIADVQSTNLPMYIVALKELGTNIPWSRLQSGNVSAPSARTGTRRGASGETF